MSVLHKNDVQTHEFYLIMMGEKDVRNRHRLLEIFTKTFIPLPKGHRLIVDSEGYLHDGTVELTLEPPIIPEGNLPEETDDDSGLPYDDEEERWLPPEDKN